MLSAAFTAPLRGHLNCHQNTQRAEDNSHPHTPPTRTRTRTHARTRQVDTEEVTKRVNWKVIDLGRRGIRSLAVAKTNDEGRWQMLGILTFLDPPRPDTKVTLEAAMELGVDVKMITGGGFDLRGRRRGGL